MYTNLKNFIVMAALVMLPNAIKSQVSIGADRAPRIGTLLDLSPANGDKSQGFVGGLLLPNVRITNLDSIPKDFTDASKLTNVQRDVNFDLKGLIVYNTNNTIGVGTYTWNGDMWVLNEDKSVNVNTANGLTKTSNNIKLGGSLTEATTIAQGKYPLYFTGGTAASDGKIFMPKVKDNIPSNPGNVVTLGIDNSSGELYAMKTSINGQTKPINYLIYNLKGEGDWVQNFDTQLDVTKYTLVVVGSHFKPAHLHAAMAPQLGLPAGTTPISNVYADKKWGSTNRTTWIIHADYVDAAPSDENNGIWEIYCLVINNSLVNIYEGGTPISSGTGSSEFSAGSVPTGF